MKQGGTTENIFALVIIDFFIRGGKAMNEKINVIKEAFEKDILTIIDMKTLNDIRTKYLGKQGKITELSKMMKDIPNEQKKEFGILVNEVRCLVTDSLEEKKKDLEEKALNESWLVKK